MGPKRSRRDGPGGVPFTALDEEDSIAFPISRGIHFVEHIGGSQEEHHSPFDFGLEGAFWSLFGAQISHVLIAFRRF